MEEDSQDMEMMGHHEEFDPALYDQYKINELRLEIEELKTELNRRKHYDKHLLWHCMMYRNALRYVPGGSSALKDTLDAFREDPTRFHSCSCCETEDLEKTIEVQNSESSEQVDFGKSTESLSEDEDKCSSCKNDALLLQINESL